MPFNCPHCSAGIDDYIPKSRFDTIEAAKKTAEAALREMQPKAAGYDTVKAELDAARSLADKARTDGESAATAARNELATYRACVAIGHTDPKVINAFSLVHNAEQADVPADRRVDLATWLQSDEGKGHPVVAAMTAKAAATTTTTPNPSTTTTPASTLPPRTQAAAPGAPAPKMTAQQVQAVVTSREYQALTSDQKRAKLNEMEAQANAQTGPAV
jgi:hypothetical protein